MRSRTILSLALALAAACGGLAWFVLRGGVTDGPGAVEPGPQAAPRNGTAIDTQAGGSTPLQGPSGSSTRGDVPAGGAATAVKPARARAEAELAVRVLLGPQRTPLAGVRLVLEQDGAFAFDSARRVDGSRAEPGESPITDEDGRAWFGVPAQQALRLRASALRGTSLALVRELDGLRPGEKRTVELVVSPETAHHVYGRIVDERGQPVHGAGVRVFDEMRPRMAGGVETLRTLVADATSDADGRFELVLASWSGRVAEVEAPGWVPTAFTLSDRATDPERPLVVYLHRSASLEVFVTDAARRGLRGLAVRISAQPVALLQPGETATVTTSVDASWHARTDVEGRAEFLDLPTDTPLDIEVLKDGKLVLRERTPLTLSAGTFRRADLVLEGTTVVHGVMRDESGTLLANHEVWIASARGPYATMFSRHDKPLGRAVTDREGRFRFKAVPVGAWAVGPSPRPTSADQPLAERLAPIGRTIEVLPGTAERVVDVDAERGLVLEGRVLGPSDKPVGGCPIRARHAGLELDLVLEADARGAFTLGPLPSGTWTLVAVPLVGDAFLPSEPLAARAGTSDLELELARGAELSGRLVDGAGNVVRKAELILAALDDEQSWQSAATADGAFRFRGVAPGRYSLAATSDAGETGLAGAFDEIVVEDEDVAGLALALAPAARLRVAFEGAQTLWFCTVSRAGRTVGYAVRNAKTSAELVVPPGELNVTLRVDPEGREESKKVTVAAGERAEVSFR